MPLRAWIVTILSWLKPILPMFQCPHELELLHGKRKDCKPVYGVSMPSRAWIVTRQKERLQARVRRFNALTSLNCYDARGTFCPYWILFQCPHELELLQEPKVKLATLAQVSMPSRAFSSRGLTRHFSHSHLLDCSDKFYVCQCPLGLIFHFYSTPLKT